MIVARHMPYKSFGTWNAIKTFIYRFDQRKGQGQVKLSQLSDAKIYSQKHTYLVHFLGSKNANYFDVPN